MSTLRLSRDRRSGHLRLDRLRLSRRRLSWDRPPGPLQPGRPQLRGPRLDWLRLDCLRLSCLRLDWLRLGWLRLRGPRLDRLRLGWLRLSRGGLALGRLAAHGPAAGWSVLDGPGRRARRGSDLGLATGRGRALARLSGCPAGLHWTAADGTGGEHTLRCGAAGARSTTSRTSVGCTPPSGSPTGTTSGPVPSPRTAPT